MTFHTPALRGTCVALSVATLGALSLSARAGEVEGHGGSLKG